MTSLQSPKCSLCNAICGTASGYRRYSGNTSQPISSTWAPRASPRFPGPILYSTFESNIMGSLYLFETVRQMKKRPVVVSACSSAEYGHVPPSAIPVKEDQQLHPLHPYGISKVCLDLLAREYFLDYRIPAVNLRLFNTTGPGKTNDAPSDFVRQLVRIKKGKQAPVIEVGNLKPRRAFLDVRDTVNSFYLAALKGKRGESYNVCATSTHEVGKMLRSAIRLAGVKVEVKPVPHLMRPSDEKIIFGSTRKFRRRHRLEATVLARGKR